MENIYKNLNETIEYIENNLFGEIESEKISQAMGLNSVASAAIFEALTGYTIKDYIKKRKLSEAVFLIRKERIVDIAIFCGYNSREGFSRAFKAFHGVNPSSNLEKFNYLERIKLEEKEPCFESKAPGFIKVEEKKLHGFSTPLSTDFYEESEIFKRNIEKKYGKKIQYGIFLTKFGKTEYFAACEEKFSEKAEELILPAFEYAECEQPVFFSLRPFPDIIVYGESKYLYKVTYPVGFHLISL